MEKRILALTVAALFATGAYAGGTTGKTGQTGQPGVQSGTQSGELTPGAVSFEDLDINSDGYVGKEEAKVMGNLADNIDQYDQNQDQQLDRSEFAQFETEILQGGEQPPGAGEQPTEEEPGAVEPETPMGGEEPGGGM